MIETIPEGAKIGTRLENCQSNLSYHLDQAQIARDAGNTERAKSHAARANALMEQETILKMKQNPRWESLPESFRFAFYANPYDETATLAEMAAHSSLVGVGFQWPKCISVSVIEEDDVPHPHWEYAGRGVSQGEAYLRVWHEMYNYLIANGWLHQAAYDPAALVRDGWFHSLYGWVEMEEAVVYTVNRSLETA